MELSDKQFELMMNTIKSNAEAMTAIRSQELLNEIRSMSSKIAELTTDIHLLRQTQETHAKEQTALNLKLIGNQDDGIIYKLFNTLRTDVDKLKIAHEDHVTQAKKNDAATGVLSGAFSLITNWAMQHFGTGVKVSLFLRGLFPF